MKIIFALALSIIVSGCAAIKRDAPDITLNKVTYIEKKDLDLLFGNYWPARIIRDEEMGYFLIELESSSNLFNFEYSNGLGLSPIFNFCDENKKVGSMGLLGIYPKEVKNKILDNNKTLSHISNDFVVITNARTSKYAPKSSIQFDLVKEPNNICLSLRGSSMAFTFETNKVKVSSELIEEAIKKASH